MSAIILRPLNPIPTISSLPQPIITSKPPKISLKPKTPYFFNSKKPIFTPKIQTLPIKNPSLTDFDDAHVTNFTDLLRLSVQENDIYLVKAVHASLVKLRHEGDTRLWNALLVACLKLGFNDYAYKVFDCMSCPDVVSFTSLVSGFAKSGWEDEAVQLFVDMISLGVEANEYSYVGILSACIRLGSLSLGSQVHGLVVKLGYLDSVYVTNALLGLYGKCGCLDSVLSLFSEVPRRDIATWNTVLSSVVKEFMYEKSFELFRCMWQIDGFRVDHFTLSTLLVACSGSLASMNGREIHAYALKSEGTMAVDEVLSASVLGVCGTLGSPVFGGQVHCHAIKSGFLSDTVVENAIMSMHFKCGNMKEATTVFKAMPTPDIVSWNGLMAGYILHRQGDLTLTAWEEMQQAGSIRQAAEELLVQLFSEIVISLLKVKVLEYRVPSTKVLSPFLNYHLILSHSPCYSSTAL
ncbi:hypothetical protein ACET3Z_022174 [Daucus carota]